MSNGRKTWPTGWRGLATIVVGIFIGATLISPAVAHVTSSLTHLWTHTDKRYYKKSVADTRFINVGEKATDSAHADSADHATSADSASFADDSDLLDGMDSSAFAPAGVGKFVTVLQGGSYTGTPPNDNRGCTVAATWTECATVTVNVPAGKTYKVAIEGTGSFFAFNEVNRVQACTSVRLSTATFNQATDCVNVPTGIQLNSDLASLSVNGNRTLAGGASGASYVVSTAVRPDIALHFYNGFDFTTLHTLVTVFEAPA